jgi:hypothetical protein
MHARFYVLNGQTPVLIDDISAWLGWFDCANRTVAFSATIRGETVSTVFLGFDEPIGLNDPAWLFQTSITGGPLDGVRQLYTSWEEAVKGHNMMVEQVKGRFKSHPLPSLLEERHSLFQGQAYSLNY